MFLISKCGRMLQFHHVEIKLRTDEGRIKCPKMNLRIFAAAVSQHYGFPGQPVTLPCPGFMSAPISPSGWLKWSICSSLNKGCFKLARVVRPKSERAQIARNETLFKPDIGDVSPSTGALTIYKFSVYDEGFYECSWLGESTKTLHLRSYGKDDFRVKILSDCIIKHLNLVRHYKTIMVKDISHRP